MPGRRRQRWWRDRRKVASAVVISLVVGTVVALSVSYEGVATADVELNDGGVWVSNEDSVLVGRLNYPVEEIDAVFGAETPDIDLLQREDAALLVDSSTGLIRPVDTAGVRFAGGGTSLPSQPEVGLGLNTVGVLSGDSGRFWVLQPGELAVLEDSTVEPTLTLGDGARATIADDGTAFGLDVVDGELVTLTPQARAEAVEADEAPVAEVTPLDEGVDLTTADSVQLSAVGDTPVVLAHEAEPQGETPELRLIRPGGDETDLSGLEVDVASARLQAPSAGGDAVVIATSDALVSVPLRGGEPMVTKTAQPGTPVQPVQVAGCAQGAWAGDVPTHLKRCGDAPATEQPVPQAAPGAELVFRVNRTNVVLNDLDSGDVWMIEDTLQLVANWEDARSETESEEEEEDPSQQQVEDVPLDRQAENRPPNAEPDELGVRAGRTIVLPVLVNDSDPDGDLLTVSGFGEVPESFGVVEPILGGRALQIRVAPEASGTAQLEYTITDGRENGEDSATATLTVSPDSQNELPRQLKDIEATVVAGERVEVNILNDVVDPDGDEVFLVAADQPTTANVDVSPDGTVTMTDLGIRTGPVEVVVQAGDGSGETAPVTIDLEVLPRGPAPPTAVFDFATGLVGGSIEVAPLANDIDPNGRPLSLSLVETTNGGTQTTDRDNGTFTFTADSPGAYYLTYLVTDDDGLSAEGLVRVDVRNPADDAAPVAVRDTALLPPGGSVAVDVLQNDSDPGGNVLAVQSIDVPQGQGLRVAILDHRILRISSTQALDGPVTVGYTVSNGTRTADGEVSVLPLEGDSAVLEPVAIGDVASVRAGDHVTIPVLRNDTHPLGLDFEVARLVDADDVPGRAFVSQDMVRFLAPSEPQLVELTYEVVDERGRTDSAIVQIYVEARDDGTNSPPQPQDVEVRAFSGERIRIPVDTFGIDPDGDSVQLLGPTSSPELGRIVDDGAGFLDYVAFNDRTGTDTFDIAVQDRLGALGYATVTVGVIPPPDANRPPVTTPEEITVRPDRTVDVDVLATDTDPDGDQLRFGDPAVVDDAGLEVRVEAGKLQFDAPDERGQWIVRYTADDGHGGRDTGSLTITVDPDAPPVPPVALDDVVPATSLIDSVTVDVDVLANDFDPDGSVEDLVVSVPDADSGAVANEDGTVTVPVAERRAVYTYRIEDIDEASTFGFIEVPGTEDTGPVLDPRAEAIQVNAGESVEIPLAEHVVALSGRPVQLYAPDDVTATQDDGTDLVIDSTTLRFGARADYAGPANITFSVTDAPDINADGILTSVVTIPIEIVATTEQPPVMRNGSLDLEAGGESQSLDISRLAADPDTEIADLVFEIGDVPAGFDAELQNGVILVASAARDTARGTSLELPVTVTDGTGDPVEASITLTATGSTAPLITANDDALGEVFQGESQRIDVLANDSNPFPGEPRTIVSAVPEQGDASVQVDGSELIITPGEQFVGSLIVVYTVEDSTGDPERRVQARVTAAVLGAPATPRPPVIQSVGDSEVVLSISAPNDNGSPITGYTVEAAGVSQSCGSTTCRISGLQNAQTYNFTVTAINAVGPSDPSPPSGDATPDVAPEPVAAPSVEFGDGELAVSWRPPVNNGSDITRYDLQISPPVGGGVVQLDPGATTYTWSGLTNGQSYEFRLRAFNNAPDPGAWGGWSRPEVPSGPPLRPQAPTLERVESPAGGQVQARWTAPGDNGDSIDRYHLTLFQDGNVYTEVSVGAGSTERRFDVDNARDYTLQVVAENRAGNSEASPQSASVRAFGQPGQTSGVSAAPTGENGVATVSYSAPNDNGQAITRYEYRLNGSGGGSALPGGGRIGGLTNGQGYTVQVRACNTYCGEWSAASASFSTYGPPGAPTVRSSADVQRVTFAWDAPGGNGATIQRSEYRVNSGGWNNGSPSDSWTSGNIGWETCRTIDVRVVNEYGQTGPVQSRQQCTGPDPTPPPPPPPPAASITVSKSRGAQGQPGCTDASCAWTDFEYRNLPNASYTIRVYASSEGQRWQSDPWRQWSAQLSGNDRYRAGSYRGFPGETVRIVISGGGNTYQHEIRW